MDNEQPDSYPEEKTTHEHFRFVASEGQKPLRVDKFLMNLIENSTRSRIQKAAQANAILVNNKPVNANYKVKPRDVISIVFDHPPYEHLLVGQQIPLEIVYEDNYLAVVNKPAGMVVHPGHGNYSNTLLNGLIHHFKSLPTNSSGRPGLVHRIDKDTSGLLVVAKDDLSMANLSNQFKDKTTQRTYIALVWGDVKENQGTIEGNIGRHPKNRLQMTVYDKESENGKPAITHYKVIKRFGYVTLVTCQLETGRTHQIRVHMKHIGHTLFNDSRYGGDVILKGTTFTKYKQFVENCFKLLPRQALHAQTLGFTHPHTKEQLTFEATLPKDFIDCINKWKTYSKHMS